MTKPMQNDDWASVVRKFASMMLSMLGQLSSHYGKAQQPCDFQVKQQQRQQQQQQYQQQQSSHHHEGQWQAMYATT